MSTKKILIDTSSRAKNLNLFIITFFLITLIIPFIILKVLENSLVAVFLTSNIYILILLILINIIFLFIGSYYSLLKIDSYIINIYSFQKKRLIRERSDSNRGLWYNGPSDPIGTHSGSINGPSGPLGTHFGLYFPFRSVKTW